MNRKIVYLVAETGGSVFKIVHLPGRTVKILNRAVFDKACAAAGQALKRGRAARPAG